METVYDLLRKLVEDHRWTSEAERVTAHGVINRADPSYSPPVNQGQVQNLTHEQMMIADLQRQLAEARGQQFIPQNAAEQMRASYGPQPASAAAANPAEMRGYAYPVPGQQAQPMAPTPQAYPQQMQQYAYPVPQPETGYQPVANPFAQQ